MIEIYYCPTCHMILECRQVADKGLQVRDRRAPTSWYYKRPPRHRILVFERSPWSATELNDPLPVTEVWHVVNPMVDTAAR